MIFAFPISDDNSEAHSQHYRYIAHYAIIFLCFLALGCKIYLRMTQGTAGLDTFMRAWSLDPKEYFGADYLQHGFWRRLAELSAALADLRSKALLRLAAHIFLQGGLLRLVANMLVLWMLGDNVQYAMGQLRYVAFVVLTGLLSGFGAALFSADPAFIGNAVATGAVMAVAAAYMFYFPAAKINVFYLILPLWIGVTAFSARLVIALYVLLQLVIAWVLADTMNSGAEALGSVVTYVASLFWGFILAWPFRRNHAEPLRQPVPRAPYRKTIKAYVQERHDDHWGHGH